MNLLARIVFAALLVAVAACNQGSDSKQSSAAGGKPGAADLPADESKGKRGDFPPPADVGVVPDDAQRSKSGLAYKVLEPGKGTEHPGLNDTVLIHLTGWRANGELHNTTRRSSPHPMVISQTSRGWHEGLRMMTVGEKRRFWMPPELAFPATSKDAPQELMTYEVELVELQKAPPIPEDVAGPPADAKKTESGISYRVLTPGNGTEHPREWDEVRIHFTGWNSYGQMLATTMMKKRPQTLPVYRKGPVWAEILGTMVVGQKSRFWVPEAITRRKQGPKAQAQVYDIELLALTRQNPAPAAPENLAEPPAGAKKTYRDVAYVRVKKGSGKKPTDKSLVTVHFTSWTTDGTLQDSTVIRGKPVEFGMGRLPIPAWAEVLKDMVPGDVVNAWVPPDKMPRSMTGRPRTSTIVFQLQLVSHRRRPEPPPAPKNVAEPPKGAQKTDKGVFYVLLEKGTGARSPGPKDRVLVNYSGWTTDGVRFDSSIPKGKPEELSMSRVIEGWRDGLATMVEGERKRLWIPEELAYKGKPGRPAGMLVFDVELVEIK